MNKKIIISLFLFIATVSNLNAAGKVALVNTNIIKMSEVNPLQEFIGTVTFDKKSKIASESSGVAKDINFEVGKRVKKGDVLVSIDSDILNAQINAANSSVNMYSVQLENAKKNFLRYQALVAKNSIAQKVFDDAKVEYDVANENLISSKAKLNELKIQKAKKTITAPYSGVIVEKNINLKEWLNVGSTVATIVNTKELELVFNLPLTFVDGLKKGDIYDAQIAEQIVKAKLYAAIPSGDKLTRTFPVRFKANVDDIFIFDGAEAKLKFAKNAKTKALVINRDAVIKRFNMDVVFAVVNDKAVMIPVQVIGFLGTNAAIAGKGLVEGMNIVVKGNERIFPDMAVKILDNSKEKQD
ncbi:efflux RND transporter periplasmic adaptor subunit [Poseidonibacter sp.]|uniref:efflux RND transporter periplasmic adaptor subunit n=1 Tax=Poseidonibacter sp. TaxID=2321188 RepID=UPI003C78B4A8